MSKKDKVVKKVIKAVETAYVNHLFDKIGDFEFATMNPPPPECDCIYSAILRRMTDDEIKAVMKFLAVVGGNASHIIKCPGNNFLPYEIDSKRGEAQFCMNQYSHCVDILKERAFPDNEEASQ